MGLIPSSLFQVSFLNGESLGSQAKPWIMYSALFLMVLPHTCCQSSKAGPAPDNDGHDEATPLASLFHALPACPPPLPAAPWSLPSSELAGTPGLAGMLPLDLCSRHPMLIEAALDLLLRTGDSGDCTMNSGSCLTASTMAIPTITGSTAMSACSSSNASACVRTRGMGGVGGAGPARLGGRAAGVGL